MSKSTTLKRQPLSNFKKYSLEELLQRYDPDRHGKDPVLTDWENARPVGNEFGSPDYDLHTGSPHPKA
jgi:hypothetical protein